MPKTIKHDWSGVLGGGYRCTCCRRWLASRNDKSSCAGMKARYDNELLPKPEDAVVNISSLEQEWTQIAA